MSFVKAQKDAKKVSTGLYASTHVSAHRICLRHTNHLWCCIKDSNIIEDGMLLPFARNASANLCT